MSDRPYRPSGARLPLRPGAVAAVGCAAACVLMVWHVPLTPAPRDGGATRSRTWFGRTAAAPRADAAARLMRAGEDLICRAKQQAGVEPDTQSGADPTGMIGDEVTPLVTTLGSLEAKRTAANPMWAAVLVRELAARDIGRGDVIAAGFSGSFPGLNLAVLSAARTLGVEVMAVSSVTASTWGANQPGFTWPEMELRLVRSGLLPRASIAVTTGGDGDVANDLEPDGRALARRIRDASARALGVAALAPRSPRDAVAQRMASYRRGANGRRIVLYVNVGGTAASLGSSDAVLRLRSGFLPARPFDRSEDRGVMARFAEQGVPVLTLLNIRDLAVRWGIPLG